MSDDIPVENDLHIVPGVLQRVGAGSEEIENRIQEHQAEHGEQEADDAVQGHLVGQDLVGDLIVPLSEQHGDHGRRPDADKSAERRAEVHQRERDSKSRDGQRSRSGNMPDVDAVHHIIERRRSHGDDSRDCVLLEQYSYAFTSKLRRSGLCLWHYILPYSSLSTISISKVKGANFGITFPLPLYL